MATQKSTVEFILVKLGRVSDFSARPMFGINALYAGGKVVALICDPSTIETISEKVPTA